MVFKVANYLMGFLFLLSAVVQLNDPDPIRWILIYLAATLACIPLRGRLGLIVPAGVLLFALVIASPLAMRVTPGDVDWAGLFQEVTMKTTMIEEAREIVGLMICCLWMVVIFVLRMRSNKGLSPSASKSS